MFTLQYKLLHCPYIIHPRIEAVDIDRDRIKAAKAELNSDISTMALSCFSQ